MTIERCPVCGERFEGEEWHPATVDDDGAIQGFCSESCKRRYVESTDRRDWDSPEQASNSSGS